MILHLTPGLSPIEVHVHNECGVSETLTVAPRAGAPAPAAPAAPTAPSGPAASRTLRRMLLAVPMVALVFGVVGYQVGSRADATGRDVARVALRSPYAAASRNAPVPRWPDSDAQPQQAMPLMRSLPLQPESAADPDGATMPADMVRALAQQPSVAPSRNGPAPMAAPQPTVPAGSNPFGLE